MFMYALLVLLLFYKIFLFILSKKTDGVKCLVGKTAVVTGGNSGLGYGICLLLASRGCKVIIADRENGEKSRDEIIKRTGNPNISYEYLDLSSFKTVRAFAEKINEREKKIDILINNAGIAASTRKITEDGLNFVMQVNYFGAFLLTHLLMDSLKNGQDARVLFASSISAFFCGLSLDKLNFTEFDESNLKKSFLNYRKSKLCVLLAAQKFSEKLKPFGISAYSYDPIHVKTAIFNNTYAITTGSPELRLLVWVSNYLFAQDPVDAAQNVLHLSISDQPKNGTWTHYSCCRKFLKPRSAYDHKFCQQLWIETAKLVGIQPELEL